MASAKVHYRDYRNRRISDVGFNPKNFADVVYQNSTPSHVDLTDQQKIAAVDVALKFFAEESTITSTSVLDQPHSSFIKNGERRKKAKKLEDAMLEGLRVAQELSHDAFHFSIVFDLDNLDKMRWGPEWTTLRDAFELRIPDFLRDDKNVRITFEAFRDNLAKSLVPFVNATEIRRGYSKEVKLQAYRITMGPESAAQGTSSSDHPLYYENPTLTTNPRLITAGQRLLDAEEKTARGEKDDDAASTTTGWTNVSSVSTVSSASTSAAGKISAAVGNLRLSSPVEEEYDIDALPVRGEDPVKFFEDLERSGYYGQQAPSSTSASTVHYYHQIRSPTTMAPPAYTSPSSTSRVYQPAQGTTTPSSRAYQSGQGSSTSRSLAIAMTPSQSGGAGGAGGAATTPTTSHASARQQGTAPSSPRVRKSSSRGSRP